MDEKQLAKEQIRGNIGILFAIYLIMALIIGAAEMIPCLGVIASAIFLTPPFTLALTQIYLDLTEGISPTVGQLFSRFDEFWAAFKVQFLSGLLTLLWSCLLIVPGIIKSYAYSQAMYILAENPHLSAREVLYRSEQMMKGHKMDLFLLGLSFIGWVLLTAITFGIAGIWVIPYMQASYANFYKNLCKEQQHPEIL